MERSSLKAICEDLNRTLRGWFGYFKHSKDNVFGSVDGYTRSRLRSILRKRMATRVPESPGTSEAIVGDGRLTFEH